MQKKFLFVFRSPPYGTSLPKEGIDALLTCAAYEQEICVLFMNDGVSLLRQGQEPENIEQKSFEKMFSALPLYDVNTIYVAKSCLAERNLRDEELTLMAQTLDNDDISQLFNQQDIILQF